MVAYSRLMAEDEAATVRTLTAYRDEVALLVQQHRGRVVDTPGDNLLAEFPTATDAFECSLEIQRVLQARNAALPTDRKMELRIGVHLGEVRVEAERIYGDGVNVAARLEGLAEPGGVCISDAVYQQMRRKHELGFEDLGDCQMKNIPDPVRVFRVRPAGEPTAPRKAHAPDRWNWTPIRRAAAVAVFLIVLVAAAMWLSWPAPVGFAVQLAGLGSLPVNPSLPEEPSVVVLPFENLSGDPEQRYVADGISEDVTAGLAGIPRILVISRNSANAYRGGAVDVRTVGRELGVRYVVEGSLRRIGERVRVTVQLIDATRDVHTWSERYDREMGDLLDLQTEITEQILGALDVEIYDAEFERLRRKPTRNLSAYEAYVRGLGHVRTATRAGIAEARSAFERAIEIDPEFGAAYAGLAMAEGAELLTRCPWDFNYLSGARELADRALALAPHDPNTHMALAAVGMAASYVDQPGPDPVRAAERAVELAPNSDLAHYSLGSTLLAVGRPLEAIGSLRRALRLSPKPITPMLGLLGFANYSAGRHEVGVEFFERARATNPDVVGARIMLARHYASVGLQEQARTLAEELLRANPECTAEQAAEIMPPPFRSGLSEHLRQAGFPDG